MGTNATHHWMHDNRLNAARGINDHLSDPALVTEMGCMLTHAEASVTNLDRLSRRAEG